MEDLLFLVHRIPYPPNKGDKIRSFHFLKALAKRYRVYLGAFVDEKEDWQYVSELENYCEDLFLLDLNPLKAKISSMKGFISGEALSIPYYKNKQFQHWVDFTLEQHKISRVLIFSSVMGQFIKLQNNLEFVADFVDVDSDKWGQYAQNKKWPESWVYRREAKKLLAFEKKIANTAKSTLFVSNNEADLFKDLAPESASKITYVNNGVDLEYFSPSLEYDSPYAKDELIIAFTGAMDYWANCDAVIWFANEVFPQILKVKPLSKFYIVGSKPTKSVLALTEKTGIEVTGRVEDIRPFIVHADLIVAPLRIARGIQNKVLEAMAMKKQIVATPAAIEGIPVTYKEDIIIADHPEKFANSVITCLSEPLVPKDSTNNSVFIKNQFGWPACTDKLISLIN